MTGDLPFCPWPQALPLPVFSITTPVKEAMRGLKSKTTLSTTVATNLMMYLDELNKIRISILLLHVSHTFKCSKAIGDQRPAYETEQI